MEIKPIRTEGDYEAALRRIEALWGATARTSDGDELDILITLVEAYEREHYLIEQRRAACKSGAKDAARKLASLGGTMPELKSIPRRRSRSN